MLKKGADQDEKVFRVHFQYWSEDCRLLQIPTFVKCDVM